MVLQDEAKKFQDEARKLLDRSLGFLKTVSSRLDERVRRTAEVSGLKLEIMSLKRGLDEASRELGRRVYDLVKFQGQVTTDEISLAIGKVEHLETRIAEKELRIAELEQLAAEEDGADTTAGPVDDARFSRTVTSKARNVPKTGAKARTKKTPSRRPATKAGKGKTAKTSPAKKAAGRRKTTEKASAVKKKATRKAGTKKSSTRKKRPATKR